MFAKTHVLGGFFIRGCHLYTEIYKYAEFRGLLCKRIENFEKRRLKVIPFRMRRSVSCLNVKATLAEMVEGGGRDI